MGYVMSVVKSIAGIPRWMNGIWSEPEEPEPVEFSVANCVG